MAKKTTSPSPTKTAASPIRDVAVEKPVMKSVPPVVSAAAITEKVAAPAKIAAKPVLTPPMTAKVVTHEQIAKRAFEISRSSHCGSEHDNWVLAERELRGH